MAYPDDTSNDDPFDQVAQVAGKVKGTTVVNKVGGKLLKKNPIAGATLDMATAAVDLGDDSTSVEGMSNTMAKKLGMATVDDLVARSSLVREALRYYKEGDATVDTVRDVAIGMAPGGAAILAAKTGAEMLTAGDNPDAAEDLAVVYDFATNPGYVTKEDIVRVIRAKSTNEVDREELAKHPSGMNVDYVLEKYIGNIPIDELKQDGETVAECLERVFNSNDPEMQVERAVLVLDNPEYQAPLNNDVAMGPVQDTGMVAEDAGDAAGQYEDASLSGASQQQPVAINYEESSPGDFPPAPVTPAGPANRAGSLKFKR